VSGNGSASGQSWGGRVCARCGARLAGDNADAICRPCQRAAREMWMSPPEVPPEFWEEGQLRDSLVRERHIGHAIRSYRYHPFHGRRPVPQDVVARWLSISQAQLARIEKGRPINDLSRLAQWAQILRIPQELLWFSMPESAQATRGQGDNAGEVAEEPESTGVPETTLKALIRERHLGYESFCREWDRIAKGIDGYLIGRYPGRAQYYRWLRGELTGGRPYPDACRILEAMFPGWRVDELFSPFSGDSGEPDFSAEVMRIMGERKVGVNELARRTHYTAGYISTLCSGKKHPSMEAVELIDRALEAGGHLVAMMKGYAGAQKKATTRKHSAGDILRLPIWAERKARGWPVRKLAEEFLNAADDPGQVPPVYVLMQLINGWEAGRHAPPQTYRMLYCKVFGKSEDQLFSQPSTLEFKAGIQSPESTVSAGFPERSPVESETRIGDLLVSPRDDIASPEDFIDVLNRVHRMSRTINPEVIRHLEESISDTIARYETLDHSTLFPTLIKQRRWIDAILGECGNTKQRQRLFGVAGATSGVLGYVAVGQGDFTLARAYCLEAFQLGDLAQEPNLQAWARGMQSFCEYYAGRYDDALRFAQDGLDYAQSGPQSVRLAINGVARALGKLGDAEGVHRTVDQAYELMDRNDAPSGIPSSISLGCYSAAQIASNAATAYVALENPEKVQYFVGLALPDIENSESPWSRSLVLIDLAFSLIKAGEPDLDRASELIVTALGISADRPIISVQRRTWEFVRAAAERWGNTPQVKAILDAASTMKITGDLG